MYKKTFRIISFVILLFTGYQIFLNFISEDKVSFENTIKIFKTSFKLHPFQQIFIIIFILLIIEFFGFIFNLPKRKKIEADKLLTDLKKRDENKKQVYNKILNENISYLESRKQPWQRINGDFHKIIVRDINDKKFPEIGDWLKLETFDLKDDGIEFFERCNIIGFDIYFDENFKWDAFHNQEKLKKGTYSKSLKPYCIGFIPYENILHVDWSKDDRNSCITIFCQFKYATRILHPYKEFRYYIERGNFLTKLEDTDKRNFKAVNWGASHLLYLTKCLFRKIIIALNI
ncbi:MAG TPA: hypothetical protein VNG53_00720 [Bacteroidia bacterium]|nr:hypothetical protein [Bacteroidia bacterium]